MLIRNAEVRGEIVDVLVRDGIIAAIGGDLRVEGPEYDAGGNALIPGLHDHHIHLNATAAAMNSLRCGPPEVRDEIDLKTALHSQAGTSWIRGIGYHESVAGDIDCAWLDANGPDRPIRIQHRSGRLWILNSRALDELRGDMPADGRFLDADRQLRSLMPSFYPDLKPLVRQLLSWGITGVTEVTPKNDVEDFVNYVDNAAPLKLSIMGRPELSSLGDARVGPVKFHYHEDYLPSLERLADEFRTAHDLGRNIACHCVTRSELMLVLAALEEAGPMQGDRIEHAAIADEMLIDWMQRLGVIVVTQPNFITERADAYFKDVPGEDHDNLWRLGSLIEAGIPVAAGSDTPFGNANPWKAMQAATARQFSFQAGEAITPEHALALYTKPAGDAGAPPRKIEVGVPADMCLLDQPWSAARQNLAGVSVTATWVGGNLRHTAVD